MRYYVVFSTAGKLNEQLAHIWESGDEVIPPLYHQGSRDWLILCRAADNQGGAR